MKHPRKQDGAVLFIVLMIIMVGTASAVFSAHTVSHEVRGTGFARQQMQTRYAARAALIGALEWFDIFGPSTVRDLMLTPGSNEGLVFDPCTSDGGCYPEPPLANGRKVYRLYPQHFAALIDPDPSIGALENAPVDDEASFGATSAYRPVVVIDVYDEHVVSKLAPGAAAQGGTKFKYMRTTLTARGRAQLKAATDTPHAEDHHRQGHETGADMRAYIVSGPFTTGSR